MASSNGLSSEAASYDVAARPSQYERGLVVAGVSSPQAFHKPMRRSTPELVFNAQVMKTNTEEYKVPYSRSFTGRTSSGYSRTSSISASDARNAHAFLQRRDSRASLRSSASAGLTTSDNASSASSSYSRPVSADNNSPMSPVQSTVVSVGSTSSHPLSVANTRLVLPNPSMPRVVIPSYPMSRSASIPSLSARRKTSYLDKLVCRICDHLYMGGIEAAYNANLLCRLNIGYVIDISNVEPHQVPRNKRSDCPCLCPQTTAHSRARMNIMIEEDSQLDLTPYFDSVNRFIESARACDKCVLIHSDIGRNRCSVLVVQYLMSTKNLNFEQALGLLKSIRCDVTVSENFAKSLKKWEMILQQPRNIADDRKSAAIDSSTRDPTGDAPFVAPFGLGAPTTKRSAWV